MDIYRLYTPNRDYRTIDYDKTPLMRIIGEEDWGNLKELEDYPYKWDDEKKDVCDAPFLIGAIPIIRTDALSRIAAPLPSSLVQQVHIKVGGIEYTILKAKAVGNILNERKSDIDRFSDGRIMDVEKYVFNYSKDTPAIFRIAQYPLFTFVTDELAESMMNAKLTGLSFDKCAVKKKWF